MCAFTAPDCYFCWRICMHNFLPDISPQRAAFVIWHYWWQQYLNQVSAGTDSKLALIDALGFGPSSSNPSAVPCSQIGLQIFVWSFQRAEMFSSVHTGCLLTTGQEVGVASLDTPTRSNTAKHNFTVLSLTDTKGHPLPLALFQSWLLLPRRCALWIILAVAEGNFTTRSLSPQMHTMKSWGSKSVLEREMIMSLHQIFIYRNYLEAAGSPPWVHFLSFVFPSISVLLGP